MKKCFVVVDNNVEVGISLKIFTSEEKARKGFSEIVNDYFDERGYIDHSEVGENLAEIIDRWEDTISVVYWEEVEIEE